MKSRKLAELPLNIDLETKKVLKALPNARETIGLIVKVKELMLDYKHRLRDNYKFYSQDLLNNLFKHPYTKIEFVVNDIEVSRLTAANYLNKLADDKILRKERLGTGNYYINEELFNLLTKR